MNVAQATEREYLGLVGRVLDSIHSRLSEELAPVELAREAGFSPFHFHRVFRAVTGESVMEHVRRVRMERAAYRLRSSSMNVGDVGFEAGYLAHEVFTRAFQMYFGVAPRAFRRTHISHLVPVGNGVHFSLDGTRPSERLRGPVELEFLSDEGVCEAHRGVAAEAHFEQLLGMAAAVYPRDFLEQLEEMNMAVSPAIDDKIKQLEEEVEGAKKRLAEARRERPREEVGDYEFTQTDGSKVMLSDLFGDKDDLVLIHNMGVGCSYCTMWADGFTGLVPHLSDRAAFVLVSPDPHEVLGKFSAKRNWNFRTASARGNSFNKDLGFENEKGEPWPGISTFRRENGKMYRIARAEFGPGDDFCAVWPVLDLLDGGGKGWEPRYYYGGPSDVPDAPL